MKTYLVQIIRSASFYPLGIFWVISMGIVPSIVANWIDLDTGLLVLTATAGILILIANHRDTMDLRNDIDVVNSKLIAIEKFEITFATDNHAQEDPR